MTVEIPDIRDEKIEELLRRQKSLEALIIHLLRPAKKPEIVKISDIASMLNSSYEYLRTTGRYLLPRFGESAFPTGAARWPVEEWLEWNAKPESEKRAAYQEYQRQQLREEARKRQSK